MLKSVLLTNKNLFKNDGSGKDYLKETYLSTMKQYGFYDSSIAFNQQAVKETFAKMLYENFDYRNVDIIHRDDNGFVFSYKTVIFLFYGQLNNVLNMCNDDNTGIYVCDKNFMLNENFSVQDVIIDKKYGSVLNIVNMSEVFVTHYCATLQKEFLTIYIMLQNIIKFSLDKLNKWKNDKFAGKFIKFYDLCKTSPY